jgi:hypothetical protein
LSFLVRNEEDVKFTIEIQVSVKRIPTLRKNHRVNHSKGMQYLLNARRDGPFS